MILILLMHSLKFREVKYLPIVTQPINGNARFEPRYIYNSNVHAFNCFDLLLQYKEDEVICDKVPRKPYGH